jgi:anaerobic ribonucleoside-triphosphate reductase activating protein
MKIRLASDLTKDSIVDGPGLRAVIWTQGCPHNCKGCHNPQTHNFEGGIEVPVSDILNDISKLKMHRGITFSGGEPMAQAEACAVIAKSAKQSNMDTWLYTGYTFESIVKGASNNRADWAELIKNIDVMVDGPFIQEDHDPMLDFKGSTNQRIIDVKQSLKNGKVVEYDPYSDSTFANIIKKIG